MTDLVTVVQQQSTLEQLKLALPSHMKPDHFRRIFVTEIHRNPELLKCDPASFMSVMIQLAALGLEPGVHLGQCYLIPFRNTKKGITEVQLIIGYRGLIALARRSGMVKRLSANVVYDGDEFDFALGSSEHLRHVPSGETSFAKITHVYAICEFNDGSIQMEVMPRREIDRIKDRGRANPVWNSDYSEMARKTAVRRLAKYLPLSPEFADAIRADQEDDMALPERPDLKKIAAFQAEACEMTDGLQTARSVFGDACGAVRAAGGDPIKILTRYPEGDNLELWVAAGEELATWLGTQTV